MKTFRRQGIKIHLLFHMQDIVYKRLYIMVKSMSNIIVCGNAEDLSQVFRKVLCPDTFKIILT